MSRPYPFRRPPYDHQKRALKFALKHKQAALFMEPRTGKTKTSIDYLSALALAGRLDRVVIVAPARVLDVWVQAFHDDCPVKYHIHIWDADARKHPIPKASASYDLNVVLVNYEAFSKDGPPTPSGKPSTRLGRFKNRQLIERWLEGKPAACVLDESHKIKSPSSKSGKMIVSMRGYFDYRLILTGTPITKAKRVFDVYQQFKFLHPETFAEFGSHEEFSNYYGKWKAARGFGGQPMPYRELVGLANEDELTEKIYSRAFRVKREDCFDLPPRTTNLVSVKLGDKTGSAYDELAKEMVAEIEHGDRTHLVEASIPLVLALRLSQITGGFATTSLDPENMDDAARRVIPLGTEKLVALEGLIDEAIDNDEKLVVAARFKPEMDAIGKMVRRKKIPHFEVRGGLTREQTTEEIAGFKEYIGTAVIVVQPQSGGVGIDLSSAAHMVWYSLTNSWVDFTQMCDRIALSQKATTFTYLLAEGTVDQVLYDVLQEDGNVAELILKDPRRVLRPTT